MEAANTGPPPCDPLPIHPALHRASALTAARDLLPTGFPPFDTAFDGLALRHTHLLAGAPGSGLTSFLHRVLATTTRTAPVLLFDPDMRFHPTAAAAAGVHLPHILWVCATDRQQMEHALWLALRADACPLVVWNAPRLPATLVDRLRPHVWRSRSALLFITSDPSALDARIDGMTLAVAHAAWLHAAKQLQGCDGRTITVQVTDHHRGRAASLSLAVGFPQPLPAFLPLLRKGGGRDASTANRGALDTGATPPMRSAG